MDRCVAAKFKQVNHNPVAILNGDRSKQIVKIITKSRDNIKLTALGQAIPSHKIRVQQTVISLFIIIIAKSQERC